MDELTQWADLTVAASHRKPLNYETATYTCLLETGQLRFLGLGANKTLPGPFLAVFLAAGYFLSGASAGRYLGLWREKAWGKRI